jgi:uncharacterized repeat protein (TIGR03803 family)
MAKTKVHLRAGLFSLACITAAVGIAPAQVSEVVVHNFANTPYGAYPAAGVIRDSAGNLYGTTQYGGTGNHGVVYKLSAAGHLTVLHNFTGGADGVEPLAGVVADSAGNLYGTTLGGGAAGVGTVYKVDTAGNETVLYSFAGPAAGELPQAGVILDSAGNLYGTTANGGASGYGVVYKVDTAGNETVLYNFTGGADGGAPEAGLIRDSAGNFYGTASAGGASNAGVAYKLNKAGHQTVLYSFTGGADGNQPNSVLLRDPAGNLYGTAPRGGAAGFGVVFKLNAAGAGTTLYTFTGGADGGYPEAGVIRDKAGNLYGVTDVGGTGQWGVLYKLDTAGTETVLCNFTNGPDGGQPSSSLIRDSSGNIRGTAFTGGIANAGVVYELDAAGQETVLYSFTGAVDGTGPAGLTGDSAGNLYGATNTGGTANVGAVYKLDAKGRETLLYSFTGGADGGGPNAKVIRDSAGNLYGTTFYGGPANAGVVFKLDPAGHETLLYSFTGFADGRGPVAGVTRDSEGNLYGTTFEGGTTGAGVVFKVDASGKETVLHSFTGADGGYPYSDVIRDSAGNLYGTAYRGGDANAGVVFELDPSGNETVLYSFGDLSDGGYPVAGVIRDSAGNLYGTASGGGFLNSGVVYKVDPAGVETVLYSFTGGDNGGDPNAGLIRDSAGNLYSTVESGGPEYAGFVYKLDAAGNYTVLYSFNGPDGANPVAGVILDSAGNLYGTGLTGGKLGGGVLYLLKGAAAPEP